jgi:hypothetical protein
VRLPRGGECTIGSNGVDYIEDQIKNGAKDDQGRLLNPIDPNQAGLGKSCQVYEPDLVKELISKEANKIIKELNDEFAKEQQKLQDEYSQELNNGASCIQNKLDDYSKNKGSGNASSSQLDTWMKECGANSELLNIQVGKDDNKQTFLLLKLLVLRTKTQP